MRCSKSGRLASASALLLVAAIVGGASSSDAQTRGRSAPAAQQRQQESGDNMRMPNVSIEGERQTPDIFFVFPTGKGGDLSAPRMRDYASDILEPVVKPWFERDQAVNPAANVASNERRFNWDEALRSEPDRPPPAAPPAGMPAASGIPAPQVPPPQIPSQATQGQLGIPSQALSVPPASSSYPAQAPSYPAQAPSYPAQAPSYPSQTSSYPSESLTYPSVPTANKPHYPAGYSPPATTARPSYPSAPAAAAPSYPASPPPQLPPQAMSPPESQSQSQRQLGIPSWATKPPPGPYQR